MSQRVGNKGSSPRASLKAGNCEHNTVTLDDVKSVAFDSMPDVEIFPEEFQMACRYVLYMCRSSVIMFISETLAWPM